MDITLSKSAKPRKSTRLVIFNLDGRTGSVQFLRTLFGETVPDTLILSGDFAEPVVKVVKAKLTKEQRAALPKLTAAEKLIRAERRVAAMRAKLAAAAGEAVPA